MQRKRDRTPYTAMIDGERMIPTLHIILPRAVQKYLRNCGIILNGYPYPLHFGEKNLCALMAGIVNVPHCAKFIIDNVLLTVDIKTQQEGVVIGI